MSASVRRFNLEGVFDKVKLVLISSRRAAGFLCTPDCVAARVEFEPTLPFRVNTLSKRAPSATRPSLPVFNDVRQFPSKKDHTLGGFMPTVLLPKHARFIKEREYLHNVSPATISWYTHAFKWLSLCASPEGPLQDELNNTVLRMRENGLKPTGANAAVRAINAYLHWNSKNTWKCGAGSTHPRMRSLKEPQMVMQIFGGPQIKLLVRWKPRGFYERRLHLLVLILLDTGCRIGECVLIRVSDFDFDNVLLTLNGKGRKQRVVPFSFELRRQVFQYVHDFDKKPDNLLLTSKDGTGLGRNVCLRDVKRLCLRLGFKPPARTLHAFRHTFGANYVRQGGSVFHLQKALGHSSLEMSRR
jgi:integrase/recombinase XerD